MLNKDARGVANRLMERLTGKGFTMARSQNNEKDYDNEKQERDSKAVAEFAQSGAFQDVMKPRQ
jgi:hypothetical protein